MEFKKAEPLFVYYLSNRYINYYVVPTLIEGSVVRLGKYSIRMRASEGNWVPCDWTKPS